MSSFIIAQLRNGVKVLKAWYGAMVNETTPEGGNTTIEDLYQMIVSGDFDKGVLVNNSELKGIQMVQAFAGKTKDNVSIRVDHEVPVHVIASTIGMYIEFRIINDKSTSSNSVPQDVVAILMSNARNVKCLPDLYVETNSLFRLRNDIIKWLGNNNAGWSSDAKSTTGKDFVEALANVMWNIDGHHDALGSRSCNIPSMFKQFQGYNAPERRKGRKRNIDNLKKDDVVVFSSNLFSFSSCSYMKRPSWLSIKEAVLQLANSLRKYSNYREKQLATVTGNHQRKIFVSDIDEWKVLEPRFNGSPSEMAHYFSLHEALCSTKEYEVIFLNDLCPNDRKRRYDYLKNIFTPYNCVIYSYTGSKQHLHFIWKVNILDDLTVRMNKNQDIKTELEKKFPKYHSRAMKKEFMSKFGRVTSTSSAMLREMYKTLTGDCSSSSNLSTDEIDNRVREFFETEDAELDVDLRANNGRPDERYSVFMDECQKYISGLETAVDDRRHDTVDAGDVITHLATALNARTLYETICKRVPADTPLPSLQWLRYQFWPRTMAQCHSHTGKLKIKYMIQARQLRLKHIDEHYASAVYRYQKSFACKFRNNSQFISADDKHTIKVGDPNYPVASVDRGRAVLCRIDGDKKIFNVGDHDFTKSSLTPSVHMALDIPETIEGSFYRGNVHVGIKDNAFQPSSAWRHATELKDVLHKSGESLKPILLIYTDGGPDHNITFVRTQLSLIALYFENNYDFLCAVRTPPHHSWKNPVERIMSILNLALNGVGMMRSETKFEDRLASVKKMKEIRQLAKELPDFKNEYLHSLDEPKRLLETLFEQLKLKDNYFKTFQPASDEDIHALVSNLYNIDESLKPDLIKSDLNKYPKLKEFLSTHCKTRAYLFSIKKCGTMWMQVSSASYGGI